MKIHINENIGDIIIVDLNDDYSCEPLFQDQYHMDFEDDQYCGFVYHKDIIIILEILHQNYQNSFPKIKVLTSKGEIGWCYYDYLFANNRIFDII